VGASIENSVAALFQSDALSIQREPFPGAHISPLRPVSLATQDGSGAVAECHFSTVGLFDFPVDTTTYEVDSGLDALRSNELKMTITRQ
jgi:hypothetical protein